MSKNFKITFNYITFHNQIKKYDYIINIDKDVDINEVKTIIKSNILCFDDFVNYLNDNTLGTFIYFGNRYNYEKVRFIEHWLSDFYDTKVTCTRYTTSISEDCEIEDLEMTV